MGQRKFKISPEMIGHALVEGLKVCVLRHETPMPRDAKVVGEVEFGLDGITVVVESSMWTDGDSQVLIRRSTEEIPTYTLNVVDENLTPLGD